MTAVKILFSNNTLLFFFLVGYYLRGSVLHVETNDLWDTIAVFQLQRAWGIKEEREKLGNSAGSLSGLMADLGRHPVISIPNLQTPPYASFLLGMIMVWDTAGCAASCSHRLCESLSPCSIWVFNDSQCSYSGSGPAQEGITRVQFHRVEAGRVT